MIPLEKIEVDLADWSTFVPEMAKRTGWRFGHLTVRRLDDGLRVLEALLLDPSAGKGEVFSARLPPGQSQFPSITGSVPAAHWSERLVGDLWGLHALGHPRWKSLILHEAWPEGEFPQANSADGAPTPRETHFMSVGGPGVHEIPVGPIHAGIIEPGHFRFSCIGEVIANLEIRLGYQHRGIEKRLTEVPWEHARHIAESVSSDSMVANALAHAEAIENLAEIEAPPRAKAVRALALEFERLASHLGDLGALASDIGFALGAGLFGRLRGAALGYGQSLAGSRFQKGLVCPGGLSWEVDDSQAEALYLQLPELKRSSLDATMLLFENPGVQERLEGVGVLHPGLAEEFGMVGPTARASGSHYDARAHFAHALFPAKRLELAMEAAGDAWARASIREQEIIASLSFVEETLADLPDGSTHGEMPDALPPDKYAVGIVESWRGELIHWLTTDSNGAISRYAIRDPSFQNWTGLAIAARNNLVADFPLINKSFNLSYSGNDL